MKVLTMVLTGRSVLTLVVSYYDTPDLKFGGGKFVATCFDSPNDLSTVNNAFHYSFTDAATTAGNTVWLKGEDTNVADNIYVNYSNRVHG